MKNFSKTLYEEVFSQKVGVNPPLIVKPEEVPIISEVLEDKSDKKTSIDKSRAFVSPTKSDDSQEAKSDDEVLPANYLFSSDQ